MIRIYYSNRLESLKEMFITFLVEHKLDNPFYSEVILVENIAMMEWLYIELARYFTVSANINFFCSFDFIWNLVNKSLWSIFPKSMMSRSNISWILMNILSKINYKTDLFADWSIIKKYLRDDFNKYKCLQLSEKVADLFIQYFEYRPDWLFQWSRRKKVTKLGMHMLSWQSELWYLFLQEINNNNKKLFCCFQYNIHKYILDFFKKNSFAVSNLPKRILIYGISLYSPLLLEILKILGNYIDIYIYCINPCRIFSKKKVIYFDTNIVQKHTQSFKKDVSMDLFSILKTQDFLLGIDKKYHINNSLLSLYTPFFQKNFCSLLRLDAVHEQELFFENTGNLSLLHILQNDILNDYSLMTNLETHTSRLTNNIPLNIKKKRLLPSNDRSLSVHVCHNIYREVEVLHDNLLKIMLDDSSILPHDIIVMAPNIDHYVSAIQSVFFYFSSRGRDVPFKIFDSSINNMNVVISSFLKLLKISDIRFTVEEILDFLKVPAIGARFNIDEDGIQILTKWILESGICWGLDDDIFSDFIISSKSKAQYTWKFGLNRMLLGYAIGDSSVPWNGILPHNILCDTSSLSISLIGQLSYFLKKLKYWKDQLLKVYRLEECVLLAEEIINDFFISDFNLETESNLVLLKNYWREVISSGIQVNYCEPVSISILHTKLCDKLRKKRLKHRFFSGGITFCNIFSVRSIPFKVVYLLGMNANSYPRNNVSVNFDLMEQKVHYNDYDLWSDDCYLFLEAFLSARKCIFISFLGCSMYDDIKYRPSVLVTELFEYIKYNFFYFDKKTSNIFSLTTEWIRTNLWQWDTIWISCIQENSVFNTNQSSFFKECLPIPDHNFNKPDSKFPRVLSSVSPINLIKLDVLRNFYRHPIRSWFQNRLKIYISKRLTIPSDEPFFVDMYTRYQICSSLVAALLKKEDINIFYCRLRASGILPYGGFGDVFWMKQYKAMVRFSEIINQYYLPDYQSNFKIFLTFDKIQLKGVLSFVQKNGLVRWKPGVLSMKDGLLLWLEHIVYCAAGGRGDSIMIGMDGSFWHFSSLSNMEAKEYLLFLIFGYLDGMNVPLLLFNHSGGHWMKHCFNSETQSISLDLNCHHEARRKLILAWKGNKYTYGDSHDPYIKKLIPELKEEDVEEIILAAKKYFLFPMQFNIMH